MAMATDMGRITHTINNELYEVTTLELLNCCDLQQTLAVNEGASGVGQLVSLWNQWSGKRRAGFRPEDTCTPSNGRLI